MGKLLNKFDDSPAANVLIAIGVIVARALGVPIGEETTNVIVYLFAGLGGVSGVRRTVRDAKSLYLTEDDRTMLQEVKDDLKKLKPQG